MELSGIFGAPLRRLEVVESTNLLLKAEAEAGLAEEGAVVVAEHQIAGRGRLDRRWEAPPGKALLFSALLYPDLEPDKLPLAGLMVAIAVYDGICLSVGRNYELRIANYELDKSKIQNSAFRIPHSAFILKWPNDILAGGRKLCGILCESGVDPKERRFVVAGVGLNVNQTADDFPGKLRGTATSLYLITNQTQPRDALLGSILNGIESHYNRLKESGANWVVQEWLERAKIVGEPLTVWDGAIQVTGVCDGLDGDGSLRLALPDCQIKIIRSGDVT